MKRLLVVAALATSACKFGDALDEYCRKAGTCTCTEGVCCLEGGQSCTDEKCCHGTCTAGVCPRAPTGAGGGTAGGVGGGSMAGGSAGGGSAGGGSTGGGAAGGSVITDPDYDGGAYGLPVPFCTPSADAGTRHAASFESCCRDYECDTGQCLGFPNAGAGRRCTPRTKLDLNQHCGDETDCRSDLPLVCDLIHDAGVCVGTFYGTIGDGNSCTPAPPASAEEHGCNFSPGTCGLPGTIIDPGSRSWPCCYDRFSDGGPADCRALLPDGGAYPGTGTCYCNAGGGCGATRRYTCPL